MLYDNAELPRAYLAGYQLTGDERYLTVATETLAFVERELGHPDGGFYSTLDAQSVPPDGDRADGDAGVDDSDADHEREEGAFYAWTRSQVAEAIDSRADLDAVAADDTVDAALATDVFCDRYGVTASGNFEGKTVLTLDASVEEVAERHDHSAEGVKAVLQATEKAVFAAREERPRPPRDEKVLAGWNGLLVSAFAEAALVDDAEWVDPAEAATGFVRDHLWDADARRLSRRYKAGDVAVEGYLEDYAFLARGAFDCYGVTGNPDHLAFALDLARVVVEEFWDEGEQTLYFTPQSGESLVARPQELTDTSTPSSAGVAAQLLAKLAQFSDDDSFERVAEGVVETHGSRIDSDPLQHPSLVLAADTLASGPSELTFAGGRPDGWRETLADTYVPRRVFAPRPASDGDLSAWLATLSLDETPPVWAGREARDGRPTVYACQARTCSPPTHDLAEALDWFA
jgi:uncharacterized protein YyaL (SSP411 family)